MQRSVAWAEKLLLLLLLLLAEGDCCYLSLTSGEGLTARRQPLLPSPCQQQGVSPGEMILFLQTCITSHLSSGSVCTPARPPFCSLSSIGWRRSAETLRSAREAVKNQSAAAARLCHAVITASGLVLQASLIKHSYSSSFSAFTLKNMHTGAARLVSPTHTSDTAYTTTLTKAAHATLFLWTYRKM